MSTESAEHTVSMIEPKRSILNQDSMHDHDSSSRRFRSRCTSLRFVPGCGVLGYRFHSALPRHDVMFTTSFRSAPMGVSQDPPAAHPEHRDSRAQQLNGMPGRQVRISDTIFLRSSQHQQEPLPQQAGGCPKTNNIMLVIQFQDNTAFQKYIRLGSVIVPRSLARE